MKTKLFTLLLVLSLISLTGYSQSKHGTAFISDSLLFDGDDANLFRFSKETDDGCKVKVQDVFGEATGTFIVDTVLETCGGAKQNMRVQKTGQLRKGVELVPGFEITTGGNGDSHHQDLLALDLGPSPLMLGRKASITIGPDCVIHVKSGAVMLSGEYNISTTRSSVSHKKTRYSVEVVQDGGKFTDIVKVYEGSVEFGQNMENEANIKKNNDDAKKNNDKALQLQKLIEDYNSGKITVPEYSKQMQELMKDDAKQQKTVTINAGYQSSITDTEDPSDPVPFDVNENHWWEH